MHDVLRQRLMRRIESLPDEQVYQVLDFIEFLESKYAERHLQAEASGLQRLAEGLEDRIRKKALNPSTLREAFQLISAADRVLSSVSSAGRQIINDIGTLGEPVEGDSAYPAAGRSPERDDSRSPKSGARTPGGARRPEPEPPSRGRSSEGTGAAGPAPAETGTSGGAKRTEEPTEVERPDGEPTSGSADQP